MPKTSRTPRASERASRAAVSQGGAPPPGLVYLAVALGAGLGGSARWLASDLAHGVMGLAFPWGTLGVNVIGSFAIGVYAAISSPGGRLAAGGALQRHFVMTGLCGGFTTFSVFSLETLRLLQSGWYALAGLNVTSSVVAWLLAVWAGYVLGLRSNQLKRG